VERKQIKTGILNDYYGGLLTELQSEIVRLYYDRDLSLAEIALLNGTSRQAVAEVLTRAEKKLEGYENKLGLLKKLSQIKDGLDALIQEDDIKLIKTGLSSILQNVKDI